MTSVASTPPMARPGLVGAIAGSASALAFTALHDLLISDIWFSLPMMLAAGGLCGGCIAWSYSRLVRPATVRSWWSFNLVLVLLFALLGIVSVLLFEPITTVAEVLAKGGRPDALIDGAMPLSLAFIPAASVIVWLLFGRSRRALDVLSIVLTCVALVVLPGLNVATLGLVELPRGTTYLVVELLGLILFLDIAFVVAFMGLERLMSRPLRQPVSSGFDVGA